jgi:hypothetical protein
VGEARFWFYYYSQSYNDCLRKCELINYAKLCKCQPFFLEEIHIDMDDNVTNYSYCPLKKNNACNETELISLRNKCHKSCPRDCTEEIFAMKSLNCMYFKRSKNSDKTYEFKVHFDAQTPMLSFMETELLTLESLFCYIGGIYGIWFGLTVYSIDVKFNQKLFYRMIIAINTIVGYFLNIIRKYF